MTPIIVIRPEPGSSATVTAAQKIGLKVQGFPLFKVVPRRWVPPPADTVDALLLGSANALRHGGENVARYVGKPAYVVGESTAEAALLAGLTIAASGMGGLQEVLNQATHPRLLRLAGEDHVALVPPSGITLIERIVYASQPQPMSAALAQILADPAAVLLHSAAAARHFTAECARLGIARDKFSLAAIGPRVAEAAGTGWGSLTSAALPSDHALLALAKRLWQTATS